jgi:phosphopantothenoylcysteine synthetase/decarboxylase
MKLKLIQNKDIAATLGTMKQFHQSLVGFALETKYSIAKAKEKLKHKKYCHWQDTFYGSTCLNLVGNLLHDVNTA